MDPVAKAENNPTPEPWCTLQAVHPLVLKICISPSQAGPWLAKLIFTTRQVRARWREVHPVSTSAAEIESFWRGSLPTLDFADNSATKFVIHPTEMAPCPVILLGFEVVREDIVAQRPGVEAELAHSHSSATHIDHVTIGNVSLPPSLMSRLEALLSRLTAWMRPAAASSEQEPEAAASGSAPTPPKKWKRGEEWVWLFGKIDQHPPPTEHGQAMEWSRKRLEEMKEDFNNNQRWKSVGTIKRRLNDVRSGEVKDPRLKDPQPDHRLR
jgi:hypothetical protein